ncbi:MAG: TrkH family potassium uptake protein [Clostridia bacterium]|nr:TrkH family potassium uptake protein [Clostridia bacterium]
MQDSKLLKTIRTTGLTLMILGISMVPSIIVGLANNEEVLYSFCIVSAICIVLGFILHRIFKPSQLIFKTRDGFIIVTVSWLLFILIGAIPYVTSGTIPNYVDAVFESCSGFTTTGASIINDVEGLSLSILFWRSFTQWFSGAGIILFAMILFPAIGISGQALIETKAAGRLSDRMNKRYNELAKKLFGFYLGMTLLEIVLLKLAGLNWFDSVIHSFSTVSTGGFSNYNEGIAHFNSPLICWIFIVFMIVASLNYSLLFSWKSRGMVVLKKDSEFKLYFKLFFIAALAIFIDLVLQSDLQDSIFSTVTDSFFEVSSIISTTGFVNQDYTLWPLFAQMVLFCLFFIGGCSGSTASGVKVQRMLVAFRLVRRGLSLKLHPNRVSTLTFDGRRLENNVVQNITSFIFFYIVLFFLGTLLITFDDIDIISSASAVASCLGNIGPGFNTLGPSATFAGLSYFSKSVLSVLMLAGRLEIYTLFVIFSKKYWQDNRA